MKKKGLLLLFIGVASVSFSQKIKVLEGDLGSLKGEKEFNVEYDYSDMGVGKFDNEENYLDKKQAEYNNSEAGRGDKWRAGWVEDREERFEPKFEELMNKYLEKTGAKVGDNSDAKYTMLVHTVFTEPGFNVYVTKKPAIIDVVVTIVETDNRDNVIAIIDSKKNPGATFGGGDFDTGVRIAEAYAICGKALGKFFVKAWK